MFIAIDIEIDSGSNIQFIEFIFFSEKIYKAYHRVNQSPKQKKRQNKKNQLKKLRDEKRTVILYESPHRIQKLLADILEICGDVDIVLARELTKKFEELRREKVSASIEHFKSSSPKGEFIVII